MKSVLPSDYRIDVWEGDNPAHEPFAPIFALSVLGSKPSAFCGVGMGGSVAASELFDPGIALIRAQWCDRFRLVEADYPGPRNAGSVWAEASIGDSFGHSALATGRAILVTAEVLAHLRLLSHVNAFPGYRAKSLGAPPRLFNWAGKKRRVSPRTGAKSKNLFLIKKQVRAGGWSTFW